MTLLSAVAVLLAWGVGLSLGVIGSGGSILALPILVYLLDVEPQAAVAMTMVVVGTTSLAGSYIHYRRGDFHAKAALLLGSAGVVGAFVGAQLTPLVAPAHLMRLFAGIMLVVGVVMLRPPALRPGAQCHRIRCFSIGVGVGILTGFLGVGGGFLIVPALVILAGVDAKLAIGASLAIIGVNSAGGLLGQVGTTTVDWPLTLTILVPALVGMWMGVRLASHVSQDQLRVGFAWSVLAVAVGILGTTAAH